MKLYYIVEIDTENKDESVKIWVDVLRKILRENDVLCNVCGDSLTVELTDEDMFLFRCPTCSKVAGPILEREYDYMDFGFYDIGHYVRNRYISFKVKEKIK